MALGSPLLGRDRRICAFLVVRLIAKTPSLVRKERLDGRNATLGQEEGCSLI